NFYGCIHPDGMALAAMCHDDCHIPNYMVKLQITCAEQGLQKIRIHGHGQKTPKQWKKISGMWGKTMKICKMMYLNTGPPIQRLNGNCTFIMELCSKCHAIWMKTQISLYWHFLFVATSTLTFISTLQRGESL